jgi:hypothetical protein
MSKRRAIISYDKLSIDQKKQILWDYPDGYINHLTTIKTPTGETLDALIWETTSSGKRLRTSRPVKLIPRRLNRFLAARSTSLLESGRSGKARKCGFGGDTMHTKKQKIGM